MFRPWETSAGWCLTRPVLSAPCFLLHFWMQVVEISSLTEHLLTECDKKDGFGKCYRCNEAVLKEELPRHIKAKDCNRECLLGPRPDPSVPAVPPGPARAGPWSAGPPRVYSSWLRSLEELSLVPLMLFQPPNRRSWQTAVLCATRTSHRGRR